MPIKPDSNRQCIAYMDPNYHGRGPDCADYYGSATFELWCNSCREFYDIVVVKRGQVGKPAGFVCNKKRREEDDI